MARVWYPAARARMLGVGIQFTTATKKILLLDAGYVYNAAHVNVSDIPSGAIVARSSALTGKTVSADAVMDADDVVFAALTGDTVTSIVLYTDTGSDSTSTLDLYNGDISSLTPDGSDVVVSWPNGANKIAKVTEP